MEQILSYKSPFKNDYYICPQFLSEKQYGLYNSFYKSPEIYEYTFSAKMENEDIFILCVRGSIINNMLEKLLKVNTMLFMDRDTINLTELAKYVGVLKKEHYFDYSVPKITKWHDYANDNIVVRRDYEEKERWVFEND